jgi:preprotein translocase subunit SecD
MIIYYKVSGIIIDFALFLNAIILLGIMGYFHATLTLPGIAGIILTIGMAVDANVLISERIKEELATGKSIRLAIDAGYDKAFTSILDSNITTLIAAACLFQFGTGPVKGFAVTLTIGLLSSMFTSIIVTKVIYELIMKNPDIKTVSI